MWDDRPQPWRLQLLNWFSREVRLKTYRCTGCGMVVRKRRHGGALKLHYCHPAGRIMEYMRRG